MTSDQTRLAQYVDDWSSTVPDVVSLLRSLTDEDWSRPTDLPGWDVHAVAAHLAHIESDLAGFPQTPVEVPELDHVKSAMGRYTESGRIARESWPPARIIDELEQATAARLQKLRDDPPTDGRGRPTATPGGMGWSWETLLSNRVIDMWMHEQDIRRAVVRPGGLNTPGAAHTVQAFTRSFGYSVGKVVAPPTGTTAVLDVRGVHPVHLAVGVDENGRAVPMAPEPGSPTVLLRMDLEPFIVLCGGRRSPSEVPVEVTGDLDLGRRILAAMAVTP